MVCAGGSSKPITPPTAVAVAGAEAYEIEDTLSWSPRRAYEYLYDQVCSTVTNPKVVVGVSFDDDAAVPVLDCDVQLRNVSVLRVSVWPSWLPPYVGARLHTPAAAKALQAAVAVVATSAAVSSIADGIASVAATAPPIPFPKLLLSGLSLEGVRRRMCLNDGILSIARPILVVTTPVALSALIAVNS